MSSKKGIGLSVGGSSIVMIFVVLAMTTFGVLAMLSARADYRFSQRTADSNTAYYAADSKAALSLAKIDSAVRLAYDETVISQGDQYLTDKVKIYHNLLTGKLLTLDGMQVLSNVDDLTASVSFSVDISETRYLYVNVVMTGFENSQRYKIESYQTVSVLPQEDDDIGLFDPDNFN